MLMLVHFRVIILWGDVMVWPYDDDLLPLVPQRYKNGFAERILLSVTVEIHRQIGEIKRAGRKPTRIHLCPVCSIRFCYEHWVPEMRPDKGPKEYLGLPIIYRSDKLTFGVWVESKL